MCDGIPVLLAADAPPGFHIVGTYFVNSTGCSKC